MKNSNPRTNGFTLIELLVVISIIALLIGILLPALGAARGIAQISASASNQRQIGIAMASYMGSNDGYFPQWQDDPGNPTWFWTTRLSADGFVPGLDVYADPTFDAPTPFLDVAVTRTASAGSSRDIASTQGGRGEPVGYNLDDRRFNRIHYGYNFVHVGGNYHQPSGMRSQQSVDATNPRQNASSNAPARLEDMQDPTSVLVTTGVRDYVLTNDPAFDDGSQPTDGEWGAHVVFDYPQLQNSTGNGGVPHVRYNDSAQIMWGDGHVSAIQVPFTQEEQDLDMTTGPGRNEIYDADALGSPSLAGGGGGGRGSAGTSAQGGGNFFDIVASKPTN